MLASTWPNLRGLPERRPKLGQNTVSSGNRVVIAGMVNVHRISRLESEGYKLDPEPQKRCRNTSNSQSQRAGESDGGGNDLWKCWNPASGKQGDRAVPEFDMQIQTKDIENMGVSIMPQEQS